MNQQFMVISRVALKLIFGFNIAVFLITEASFEPAENRQLHNGRRRYNFEI